MHVDNLRDAAQVLKPIVCLANEIDRRSHRTNQNRSGVDQSALIECCLIRTRSKRLNRGNQPEQVLEAAAGVTLVDDPEASKYPMPLTATGKYDVEVRD